MKITVIYPKGQFGSTEDQEFEIEVELPEGSPGPDPLDICERVFRMMNRVDGSEIEHYLDKFQCRSLSVGDLVGFPDGRIFCCDMTGWREITPAT
jgi:hypothetical protein